MSLAGLAALLFCGLVEGAPLARPRSRSCWIFGKILGSTLLKRTSEKAFRLLSLGVVILTGALGVAAALWAWW